MHSLYFFRQASNCGGSLRPPMKNYYQILRGNRQLKSAFILGGSDSPKLCCDSFSNGFCLRYLAISAVEGFIDQRGATKMTPVVYKIGR